MSTGMPFVQWCQTKGSRQLTRATSVSANNPKYLNCTSSSMFLSGQTSATSSPSVQTHQFVSINVDDEGEGRMCRALSSQPRSINRAYGEFSQIRRLRLCFTGLRKEGSLIVVLSKYLSNCRVVYIVNDSDP